MQTDLEVQSEAQYFPCGCFFKVRRESGEVVQLEARVCSACFDQQSDNLFGDPDEGEPLQVELPFRRATGGEDS